MALVSLEYIAGFFDGEGNIGIYSSSNRNGCSLRLQVTQNVTDHSTPLLESFRELWGGSLTLMSRQRRRTAWNYQTSGISAVTMLKAIHPFLVLKRAEADAALEWWAGRLPPERGPNGRMLPKSRERAAWDETYAALLKSLKRGNEIEPLAH